LMENISIVDHTWF